MKKIITCITPLISLLAISCTASERLNVISHEQSAAPYKNDTRGDNSFPLTWDVKGKKLFVFNPQIDEWAAYDAQGKRVRAGSASGGRDYCNDIKQSCRTVTGTFHVFNKKGPDCKSNEYPIARDGNVIGGAKMPYCMHFHNGYAIHGASKVPNYNSSHGCIRVLPSAAKWLNQHFIDVGTTVLVLPYA